MKTGVSSFWLPQLVPPHDLTQPRHSRASFGLIRLVRDSFLSRRIHLIVSIYRSLRTHDRSPCPISWTSCVRTRKPSVGEAHRSPPVPTRLTCIQSRPASLSVLRLSTPTTNQPRWVPGQRKCLVTSLICCFQSWPGPSTDRYTKRPLCTENRRRAVKNVADAGVWSTACTWCRCPGCG